MVAVSTYGFYSRANYCKRTSERRTDHDVICLIYNISAEILFEMTLILD